MLDEGLIKRINELKKDRRAVLLAHMYQLPEIHDVADFVGDSLELSYRARDTEAEVIVFCGVKFMAETAKIISPDKTVLMPEPGAGCPMADMITAQDVRALKAKHPGYAVVCYVNSSAEVKAESDVCCTSSNAVRIVDSIPREQGVIFIPDVNLGTYASNILKRENMVLWQGHCSVHSTVTADEVRELKALHPGAVVMVHPECRTEVVELADQVLSTSGMIKKVADLRERDFIVITEQGIAYPMQKKYPDKKFYFLKRMICPNMKKTTIELVESSLESGTTEIDVDRKIMEKAKAALERMLQAK